MSAEQTPDIETALTEAEVNALGPFIWGGWLGVDPEKHSDYAHELLELVGHIKADALAAAVRDAEQRALREAAVYVELVARIHDVYRHLVMDTPEDREMHARHVETADKALALARNHLRADRVAEPQHEAATSGKEAVSEPTGAVDWRDLPHVHAGTDCAGGPDCPARSNGEGA